MSLLKSVVFTDIMEVISADNNGPLHLHLLDNSSKDTSSDRYVASEGALLVDVGTLDGLEDIKCQ